MQFGNIVDNLLDLAKNNIVYVPIDGSINTYITNATAGDTLILAAGTYTVASAINVSKALTIVGQGISATTVTCSTASVNVFNITASNVRIADLSILNTGGTSAVGINTTNDLTGLIFEHLNINISGAGADYGVIILGSNATIRDTVITTTSSGSAALCIDVQNNSSTTINATVNCYNVYCSASGAGSNFSMGFRGYNNNDANTVTINLYNCVGIGLTSGGAIDSGLVLTSSTTNTVVVNAYNCTFNGQDYDVYQTGSNIPTIYNCILVNNTVSGTISYGTTSNNSLFKGENIKYVPLTDGTLTQTQILNNAITNATAGDTLILAAGTYTITANINVTKSLTIKGSGKYTTTVTTSTAGIRLFNITSSNVLLMDMSVTNSNAGANASYCIYAGDGSTQYTNINITNVYTAFTGATTQGTWNIWYNSASGTVQSCNSYSTAVTWLATGIGLTNGLASANTVDVYNSWFIMNSSSASVNCYGSYVAWTANGAATLNLYNCNVYSNCSGGANGYGGYATGASAYLVYYNCTIRGNTQDLYNYPTTPGNITLHNSELVNNTTSGTIGYLGTIKTKNLQVAGQIWSVKYTCTTTLDWNNGNVQYMQLASANQTFTFANPKDGARYTLILKQPAGGAAGTVTWPGTVAWPGSVTPTLTPTNSRYDVITFVYDGTNTKYYGVVSYNYT